MTGVEQNDSRIPRNRWLVYLQNSNQISSKHSVIWGWFLDSLRQGLKNPKLSNFKYSVANSQFSALQFV